MTEPLRQWKKGKTAGFSCRFLVCLTACLLLLGGSRLTYAVGGSAVNVAIPIEQTIEGDTAEKVSVTYELTSRSNLAPMPEGTQNGAYSLTMTGNTSSKKLALTDFASPGDYTYRLQRVHVTDDEGNEIPFAVSKDTTKQISGGPAYCDLLVRIEQTPELQLQAVVLLPDGTKGNLKFDYLVKTTEEPPKNDPTPEDDSSPNGKKPSSGTVNTGDDRPFGALIGMMILSVIMMLCLILLWKRENKKDKQC